MKNVKLGTRGSRLALWQAENVAERLKYVHPDIDIDLKIIKTQGDKILDVALSRIGDKGLFTAEIEKELLNGNIDIAVHSLKDLPAVLPPGLCIGAVLPREKPNDVLISHQGYTLSTLPPGASIGTSSLRRVAQIKHARPDINIVELRGNIETRIRKMAERELDGIILAYAGVTRLGFNEYITEVMTPEVILPAVGQGAIAVEARAGDSEVQTLLNKINDLKTFVEVSAERSFLNELQGGCQVPIAALARVTGNQLQIQGLIASLDGRELFYDANTGLSQEAVTLGQKLAARLLDRGAGRILAQIKELGGLK
ncbi:MAG: hydroxymethylbilane synthase [Syntrophomonadaceae bacterium]|jgi:hydroxymethylbilane synthase